MLENFIVENNFYILNVIYLIFQRSYEELSPSIEDLLVLLYFIDLDTVIELFFYIISI